MEDVTEEVSAGPTPTPDQQIREDMEAYFTLYEKWRELSDQVDSLCRARDNAATVLKRTRDVLARHVSASAPEKAYVQGAKVLLIQRINAQETQVRIVETV